MLADARKLREACGRDATLRLAKAVYRCWMPEPIAGCRAGLRFRNCVGWPIWMRAGAGRVERGSPGDGRLGSLWGGAASYWIFLVTSQGAVNVRHRPAACARWLAFFDCWMGIGANSCLCRNCNRWLPICVAMKPIHRAPGWLWNFWRISAQRLARGRIRWRWYWMPRMNFWARAVAGLGV